MDDAGLKRPGDPAKDDVLSGATMTAPGHESGSEVDALTNLGMASFSREGWLKFLAKVQKLRQLGIALAWGCISGQSPLVATSAEPRQASGRPKHSGGLFPLPIKWPDGFSDRWRFAFTSNCIDFSAECWLACVCTALNNYYGCPEGGMNRKPGKVHSVALEALLDRIKRFLQGETLGAVCFGDAVADLKLKRVSYTGEEVSQPYPLTAVQIEKSLPPVGHGGCIRATDFLVGRTKFLLENPQECLLPLREREKGNMQARVHIKKGEELSVFKLLESRGVIDWLPAQETFGDESGECLNGLFGVVKPSKFTSSGEPILRVIMNLIPANRLFQVICGDVQLLPHGSAWLPLVVSQGEELRISQGDMSSAFYLFSIPQCWRRFMCFAYQVDGAQVGRQAGCYYRPCCVVLPMGWSSSVGIMQMITRQLLLLQGLPQSLELHKGRAVPPWFTRLLKESSETTAWWQVYLDNFMSAEKVSKEFYREIDVGLQGMAMNAWHSAGVLTADDKQVLGSNQAIELGIRLDGSRGLLGSSPERILKTCFVTIHLLLQGAISRKDIQIVLGRWIFVLQFRRAAMGVLSRSWEAAEAAWPSAAQRQILFRELFTLLFLAPVLQADLQCDYDEQVSCSDASEGGGAAATSSVLSWSGQSLVRTLRDPASHPIPLPNVVISAFSGVGGSFRVYDILGIKVMGKISIEIARDANRVSRSTWPDIIELHDINDIDERTAREWANMFPRALEIHVWGGFPCIHLSRVRAFRENLLGEGSYLFWKLHEVIGHVQKAFQGTARVKFVVENVASMDEDARQEISSYLEVQPVKLDPCDTLPFNRPRLAWCSEELVASEELSLWQEKDYVRAYVMDGYVKPKQWIKPGWSWPAGDDPQVKFPTFMKSIPRRVPPPFPAGLNKTAQDARTRWQEASFRFPPYQYDNKYLLVHPQQPPRLLEASEREILLGLGAGHTATCKSASEAKSSWTAYEDSCLSLCGDSFAISSFAIMGAAMCSSFLPPMKPSTIIHRLGLAPGASAHPSLLVPMTRWLAYGSDGDGHEEPDALVRYLGMQVNHTGSDVRLATGEPMGKRGTHGSLRAWWWQWKHCFKVRSRADRQRKRAGIRLRDFAITERTRLRYESAVACILPHLEAQENLFDLDGILCDWIEWQWARGESLTLIADGLSGLHFFWPEVRGQLKLAWRLFRSWRRVEAPARAPPLTIQLACAFLAKAVDAGQLGLASLIGLGFHALLRTGELLKLRRADLEFTRECGVITLHQSKSGLRTGAQEAVAIRDTLLLEVLETWVSVHRPSPGDLIWPFSGGAFRKEFEKLCNFFQVTFLQFKPYSLRRGGATFLLQAGMPLESILVRGRWRSLNVARLYLEDGLAQAMAPEFIHWKSSRMFFHLPDAAQGVRSTTFTNLEAYLQNMMTAPSQEKVMEFKETFTLLSQVLFRYRYVEPIRHRADVAACGLCDARDRERRRAEQHQAISADAKVAVAFCIMSRRSAHELRKVVRETWGKGLAGKAPSVVQRFFVGKAANTSHALHDLDVGDVVELPVVESYRTLNIKALSMLSWAHKTYPNLQWLVRHDDDVYLRAPALLAQLSSRPPIRYFWGMFDHGSSPVRDPPHQHYNSYEQFPKQEHPAWGDIFPPYVAWLCKSLSAMSARGLLWAMSADLVAATVKEFMADREDQPDIPLDEVAASSLPHPDDPAVGVLIAGLATGLGQVALVQRGMSVNLDDRDFNSFSLNPSCNSTFSNIHNRTWVVHHVQPETMRCMWELDNAEEAQGISPKTATSQGSADCNGTSFWEEVQRRRREERQRRQSTSEVQQLLQEVRKERRANPESVQSPTSGSEATGPGSENRAYSFSPPRQASEVQKILAEIRQERCKASPASARPARPVPKKAQRVRPKNPQPQPVDPMPPMPRPRKAQGCRC
eukprot:s2010_g1.t1